MDGPTHSLLQLHGSVEHVLVSHQAEACLSRQRAKVVIFGVTAGVSAVSCRGQPLSENGVCGRSRRSRHASRQTRILCRSTSHVARGRRTSEWLTLNSQVPLSRAPASLLPPQRATVPLLQQPRLQHFRVRQAASLTELLTRRRKTLCQLLMAPSTRAGESENESRPDSP